MKKFILEAVAVIAFVISVDFALGIYLERNHALVPIEVAQKVISNRVDIAMMGASEMQNQYNTPLIVDSLDMTAYNYGCGGQNIYFQYALLNLMLHKASVKPKYIIMESQPIDFYDTPGWNTEKLSAINSLYNYDDSVQSVLNLQDRYKVFMLKFVRLFKFNTRILKVPFSVLSDKFHAKDRKDEMGYLYMDENKVITQPIQENTTDKSCVIDSQKVQYLRRFITLCKQNDIKLIFVNAPYYEISSSLQWEETLTEICTQEGIPFLNYNHNEFFQQHPEWYYNPVHFNKIGSDYYCKMIISDLRKTIH